MQTQYILTAIMYAVWRYNDGYDLDTDFDMQDDKLFIGNNATYLIEYDPTTNIVTGKMWNGHTDTYRIKFQADINHTNITQVRNLVYAMVENA